jgi:hypothetical protein
VSRSGRLGLAAIACGVAEEVGCANSVGGLGGCPRPRLRREAVGFNTSGDEMRHGLFACGLMLAAAFPVAARPLAASAEGATRLETSCAQPTPGGVSPAGEPELAGLWDFYIDAGGIPSFGLLTLGRLDGRYAGTLTPVRTAPVIVRSLTVKDRSVRMVVGSGEGDVVYDARLSGAGDRMCGMVRYHGGLLYPMVAQRRAQRSPAG